MAMLAARNKGVARKKGKKNRKHGRNVGFCKAYRLSNRREHNKVKRLTRLLSTHPNDACIKAAIERCKVLIRGV
jgi:hypothetical protein